ncbi:MAG: hypothetical protein ACC663_10845, partial [Gammaproteobacteria bacterium]
MNKLSLKRGLHRLWVVLAGLWIISSTAYVYINGNLPAEPQRGSIAKVISLHRDKGQAAEGLAENLEKAHIRELIDIDLTPKYGH